MKRYVRALVRSPEGDILVKRFGVKRYGLLVLDADGRQVGTIDLRDIRKRPELAARRLEALAVAPALEMHRVALAGPERKLTALRDVVRDEKGVREATLDGGVLTITGKLPPRTLTRHAKTHGVSLTYRTPFPVKLPEAPSAGVWYVEDGLSYVTSLLMNPKRLGVVGDRVKTRTVRVPGLRIGSTAHRVLLETLGAPGVINVLPDLRAETIDVVGVDDPSTWTAVRGIGAIVPGRARTRS
ncbi:MAG: hypothetical protein ACYTF9_11290 [Planctomycetota bacterium]|jgi:hypothetical protein